MKRTVQGWATTNVKVHNMNTTIEGMWVGCDICVSEDFVFVSIGTFYYSGNQRLFPGLPCRQARRPSSADDFLASIFQMILTLSKNHLGIISHPHQPQAIWKQNKTMGLVAYMTLSRPSNSMGPIELLLIDFFA